MTVAYAPRRDIVSKVRRRMTQHYAARAASLSFAQPILSITFDDFPASAADAGARVLERHGARGAYYAASGMAGVAGPCGVGYTAADIARLVAAGHEIGCHTSAHADCARQDVFTTLEDLARNRDALQAMGAPSPRSHAFPYGETSKILKDNLPPRFATARGILPGLNVGRTDLAQLRAYPLFGEGAMKRVYAALKTAAKRKAWVIGFTHDVSDTPSAWGTTAGDLNALLTEARKLGFVILPVSAALARRLP
ncbi:MAG: polysaccharide deacetylase family protein [Hyphomonadaceae bacterium]|nr:polysaccharide deacetylase family protein [Hyphomonadaceae bacterium]